jgi:hypothetical protein
MPDPAVVRLTEALAKARAEIKALCQFRNPERRTWTMHIPVWESDSDIVIGDALDAADALLAAHAALTDRLARAEADVADRDRRLTKVSEIMDRLKLWATGAISADALTDWIQVESAVLATAPPPEGT